MKLEEQVANLQLSQRLKELGLTQESYYCYRTLNDTDWELVFNPNKLPHQAASKQKWIVATFSVAEFGELLPRTIQYDECELIFASAKYLNNWWRAIYYEEEGFVQLDFIEKTEADARAKMLIYLLENGMIKYD